VTLYRSWLGGGPARYEALERVPLGSWWYLGAVPLGCRSASPVSRRVPMAPGRCRSGPGGAGAVPLGSWWRGAVPLGSWMALGRCRSGW